MATSVIKSNSITPSYATLTLNSGISGAIRIMRYGKMRVLFGACNPNVASVSTVLATLDEGDSPPINLQTSISGYSATSDGELTVYSDGRIVMPITSVPTNNCKFCIAYGVL